MQINSIDNTVFQQKMIGNGIKKTFKRQASLAEADHLEAMSRLHYMKFLKAERLLDEIKPLNSIKKIWQYAKNRTKMLYHKFRSFDFRACSYHERHRLDEEYMNKKFKNQ